jgi:tape measure domain-containing protein
MNPNAIDIKVTAQDLASTTLGGVGKQLSTLEGLANKVSKAFVLAGTAIIGAGTASLKSASDFEQQAIAFKVMLGSADQAITLLSDLQDFAKTTPFELTDLQQYTKQLLAYNFAAGEIIPTLTSVGNIAAGVGEDKIPILIRALGQIRAKGELKGQELLQLTETGLPIAETLAKNVGVSVRQLNEDVSGLHIPFQVVLDSIKEIEQTRFAGLMSEQANSLKGIFSNIGDVLTTIGTKIGINSGLLDTAKYYARGLLDALDKFSQGEGIAKLTADIKVFTVILRQGTSYVSSFVTANQSLITTLLKIGTVIGAGILIWNSLMVVIKGATTLLTMFSGIMGPTLAITIVLTTVLYGYIKALSNSIQKQVDMKSVVEGVNNAFKKTADLAKAAGNSTTEASSQMTEAAVNMQKAIDKENKAYKEQYEDIVRNARERLLSNQQQLASEKKTYDETQKQREQQHKDELTQIKDLNKTRLEDLSTSLRRSIVIGSSTYQEDLANYRRVVEQTKMENQKRIDDSESAFKQETETQLEEYNQRTDALRKQIQDDQNMLNTYSEEIRGMKIRDKEDEITILKQTHKERLQEIRNQYDDEVSIAEQGAAGMSRAMEIAAQESEEAWAKAFSGIPVDLKIQMPTIQDAFYAIFQPVIDWLTDVFYNASISIAKTAQSLASSLGLKGLYDSSTKYLKSQGVKTGVSGSWAKGSESIPNDHLALVHKGEKIIPASQNPDNPDNAGLGMSSNKSTVINNYFYNTMVDVNSLSSRISFQLRNS